MKSPYYTQGYLSALIHLDKKPRCNPGNKPCGDRCIPVDQECHIGQVRSTPPQSPRPSLGVNKVRNGVALAGAFGIAAVATHSIHSRKKEVEQQLDKVHGALAKSVKSLAMGAYGVAAKDYELDAKIDSLPLSDEHKSNAKSLVGAAKKAVAGAGIGIATGAKVVNVDKKNNSVTYLKDDGNIISVGSAGTKLITFTSQKQEQEEGKPTRYMMNFAIDGGFDRKTAAPTREGLRAITTIKSMAQEHITQAEDGSLFVGMVHAEDGLKDKRMRMYQKSGFYKLGGMDEALFAGKADGKLVSFKSDAEYSKFYKKHAK